MKKNYISNLILFLLISLLFLYLLNSNLVIANVLNYTKIFIETLFPANFLFFTMSSLLIDYKLIEKIENKLKINSSIFYVLIISLISGFPSGAKNIKELLEKKLISEKTANYLITFTHFPNPLFILSTSRTIFSNNKYPILILISIIISNLFIGLITYKKESSIYKNNNLTTSPIFAKALSNSIANSIKTIILIYGSSIFFVIAFKIITKYLNLSLYKYIFFNGLFDLTEGIYNTVLIKNNIIRSLYIIFFTTIGSLSIHTQVKSIITNTQISYKQFLLGRIFSTILALSLFLIFCLF